MSLSPKRHCRLLMTLFLIMLILRIIEILNARVWLNCIFLNVIRIRSLRRRYLRTLTPRTPVRTSIARAVVTQLLSISLQLMCGCRLFIQLQRRVDLILKWASLTISLFALLIVKCRAAFVLVQAGGVVFDHHFVQIEAHLTFLWVVRRTLTLFVVLHGVVIVCVRLLLLLALLI